jgi:hypothetical protein
MDYIFYAIRNFNNYMSEVADQIENAQIVAQGKVAQLVLDFSPDAGDVRLPSLYIRCNHD